MKVLFSVSHFGFLRNFEAALHALAGLHVEIDFLRESCLDFIDTLWTGQGFCGNWADDVVDSEYSYYGLLALGHLSV